MRTEVIDLRNIRSHIVYHNDIMGKAVHAIADGKRQYHEHKVERAKYEEMLKPHQAKYDKQKAKIDGMKKAQQDANRKASRAAEKQHWQDVEAVKQKAALQPNYEEETLRELMGEAEYQKRLESIAEDKRRNKDVMQARLSRHNKAKGIEPNTPSAHDEHLEKIKAREKVGE